jgi:hypothetical protein
VSPDSPSKHIGYNRRQAGHSRPNKRFFKQALLEGMLAKASWKSKDIFYVAVADSNPSVKGRINRVLPVNISPIKWCTNNLRSPTRARPALARTQTQDPAFFKSRRAQHLLPIVAMQNNFDIFYTR